MYSTIEDVPVNELEELSIVKVGSEHRFSVYMVRNGRLNFMQNVKVPGNYPVYLTKEMACKNSEPGQKVAVGHPMNHIVYRVSQSKDDKGEVMNILNFSYLF